MRAKGDFGVDASTPRAGVNDWPRMRRLGLSSPILEMQLPWSPTRRVQPDLRGMILSPVAPVTGTRDIMAQSQSAVETGKMASPIWLNPEPSTTPAPRRPVRFTNTAVPKFDGTVCWHQHQQMFNAIAKSNGWDDETAAL